MAMESTLDFLNYCINNYCKKFCDTSPM